MREKNKHLNNHYSVASAKRTLPGHAKKGYLSVPLSSVLEFGNLDIYITLHGSESLPLFNNLTLLLHYWLTTHLPIALLFHLFIFIFRNDMRTCKGWPK